MSPEQELEDLVSLISEEACCAGWEMGIEFDLWDRITSDRRDLVQITLSEDRISHLQRLRDAVGGWIVFQRGVGPTVIPLSDWESLFLRWKNGELLDSILQSVPEVIGNAGDLR